MTLRHVAGAALLFAAVVVTACSQVVPADLPSFSCVPNVGGACPTGEYCTASGACEACRSAENACDGLDEDCDGTIDDRAPCAAGQCIAGRCVEIPDAAPPRDSAVPPDASPVDAAPLDATPPQDARVPDDVVTCTPANCPPPSSCDVQTQRCVTPAGSVPDGGSCTSDSSCAGSVCATAGMTPATWVEGGRFCTRTCCSSSQCAAGFVCAAAGTGARYCLKASVLGIAALGSKNTGDACGGSAECRSGRCDGGSCTDVCCSDASCGFGRRCTLTAVTTGAAAVTAAHCRAAGGNLSNLPCAANGECSSGVCRRVATSIVEPSFCMAHCCSSTACGTARSLFSEYRLRCAYERPSGAGAVLATCREGGNASGKRLGEACVVDGDCLSAQCDSNIGKCTDVCCTNADCASQAPGWRCVPVATPSPYAPRCQPPAP